MGRPTLPPTSLTGYQQLVAGKVQQRMQELGIPSVEALAKRSAIDWRTVQGICNGARAQSSNIRRVLVALDVADALPYLHPDYLPVGMRDQWLEEHERAVSGFGEWLVDGRPSLYRTASNGLQYCILRLKHRHLAGDLARGKCYHLGEMPDRDRETLQEQLLRHAAICRRLERHPQFPIHRTTGPGEPYTWWVVDEWIAGSTLAEVLGVGPLASVRLARVMQEILAGLAALHAEGILRRELSPEFVQIREADDSVVLNDFELGKLLGNNPTVSSRWERVDPYRAPEIAAPDVDHRADLYSWGRILVHAATGALPKVGREDAAISEAGLPKKVHDVALACVEQRCSCRPASADEVALAIADWR